MPNTFALSRLAALAFSLTLLIPLVLSACSDETGPGADAKAGEWKRLDAPPLSARSQVVGIWTGEEALFVGGTTFLCPPNADCGLNGEPLADGAAYNPTTGAWRQLSPAPIPFAFAWTAAVGDEIYLVPDGLFSSGNPPLLRYSIPFDSWQVVATPRALSDWSSVSAAGAFLVVYLSSHEGGVAPDLLFDPSTGRWSELPASPLANAFDRQMVGLNDHVYLFDNALVDNPGSETPSLARAARYDVQAGAWERLPDSEILASGPWLAEGARLVNPQLGSADGGEVNNWGRDYPYGGIFDTATETWSALPSAPGDPEFSAGALGSEATLILGMRGWVLDLERGEWIELPGIPDSPRHTRRNLLGIPGGAIAFGGERWEDASGGGSLLGDAWIWIADRTP